MGLGVDVLAQDAYLVKEGQSVYCIVLSDSASPSEQHAAEELQQHFKACTGVELSIERERPAGDTPMIVLGCGPVAQGLGVNPKPEELGEQGYVLRTVSPHLVIAGTPMAGTLYGVYDFLEDVLGVRWYAPEVTKTPTLKECLLPQLDKKVNPPFAWRHTSYTWPGADADFRARQRNNGGGGGPDHPQGNKYEFDGRAHSYFWYVSPSEFFKTHPEYFSEIGGVRRDGETQLCLTNPDVLDIVAERMLKRMAEKPGMRQHNFSQKDYYSYCECDRCKAMNEKYGTTGGTQFWFVNQLAERTSKIYPDKLIGTLAYTYTEEPPKNMKMHPNVAVWLCHMFPSCDSHPIATCPLDAEYKRRALAWSKICSHLYIWHYIVDFAHYYNPFPNFGAMAADIRFYRDIGVEGIYLQAMGHGGGGGEFSLLRPYYGSQLLWNPDRDPDVLMRDFLGGYYGAAAGPIHEYIKMLQAKVDDDNIHMHLYTNPAMGYLTDNILERAMHLFDEAEEKVKDDAELLERVKVARMPLTYARTFPRNGYTIGKGELKFNPPAASLAEAHEMVKRMEEHGFATLREQQGDPNQLVMFAAMLNSPIVAPSIHNEFLAIDVVPLLGGRVLRIVDQASGQCITANNIVRNLFFPFAGGEEFRLGSYYMPTGMFEQYNIVERTDFSIVLGATFSGFDVRRTVTLAEDAPVLTITTEIKNATDKPREAIMRGHLEFDLGKLEETRVQFVNRSGAKAERTMQSIIPGLREGERYLKENVPAGSWTFTGTKGLEVTQRFDESQMDFTWLYAYPDYLGELELELWTKPAVVEPGASMTLQQEIEVRPTAK